MLIPVLLYHSVSGGRSRNDSFAVSAAAFEEHADAIARSGRTTLRISELASGLRGEMPLPDRAAAITFDDGFADNEPALYSLLARNLRSTIYVTTGELGGPDRLTASQVGELSGFSAIEVGAHSVHHPYLDELSDEDIASEIRLSKAELEGIIERAVSSFAYPHGAYDRRVRQAVIDAGYSSAAAVKNAVSHSGDDPFAVARWTVTAETSSQRIVQVLEGHDVPLAWKHERLRTRAYRTVRRRRRWIAQALGKSVGQRAP